MQLFNSDETILMIYPWNLHFKCGSSPLKAKFHPFLNISTTHTIQQVGEISSVLLCNVPRSKRQLDGNYAKIRLKMDIVSNSKHCCAFPSPFNKIQTLRVTRLPGDTECAKRIQRVNLPFKVATTGDFCRCSADGFDLAGPRTIEISRIFRLSACGQHPRSVEIGKKRYIFTFQKLASALKVSLQRQPTLVTTDPMLDQINGADDTQKSRLRGVRSFENPNMTYHMRAGDQGKRLMWILGQLV